jgi:hypothetical protein
MDKSKKEIRFLIDKKIRNELEKEAKECGVPLVSYIKSHIKEWRKKCQKKKKHLVLAQD